MEGGQPSSPDLFLDIPFAKRWEKHKNTIRGLYIDEGKSVEEVADIMKHQYQFDANVRQYKYHFKKWDTPKSVSSAVKDQAIQILGKRARDGASSRGIRYKGVEIDKKKLRRHIDDQQRNTDFKMITSVFGRWNVPYQVLKATSNHLTPGASNFSTPSDYSVFSPPVTRDHPTPSNAHSPADAPTPTVRAIQLRTHRDRSRYLLEGQIDELLNGMPSSDKMVVTTWLHQFWMFSFTTVKHWGKGPPKWTADLLRMTEFRELASLPGTPATFNGSSAPSPSGNARNQYGAGLGGHHHDVPLPSPLCRWCIHVNEPEYEGLASPPPPEGVEYDVQDPDNWPRWAEAPCTVMDRLHDALEDNSFSSISTQDLPLSTAVIATAAAGSPKEMTVEVLSFAIMARNADVIDSLIDTINHENLDLSSIYPYHLAASHLDGSSVCCEIFYYLMGLVKQNVIRRLYVNDLGHTVLDSLMLTILKGHTSCTPTMIDERLKTMTRFPGEDMDICGRWDADSTCLRALNACGSPKIPSSWKHMFCHTAVQAICHVIHQIFSRDHAPTINTPSGLFNKTCFTCGDGLVPGPIHTLVLTAFSLAQNGCEGENLFGMLACLVCLLVNGADPAEKANLSINALLGTNEQQECTHQLLDPLELGEKVPSAAWDAWTEEAKVGWECLMAILRFVHPERARRSSVPDSSQDGYNAYFDYSEFPSPRNGQPDAEDSDMEDDDACSHDRTSQEFCANWRQLGVLWSAIQTELLSYRQLREGDPWLSDNFDLTVVRDGANAGVGFSSLPLVDRKMMRPACSCGRFEVPKDLGIATTDDACAFYFSNMEDWKRSTFRPA
ncbi:hypothetical protein F5Y14DRAFT_427680 [Nemania sp. NC0429]|nr:hypothetical protein F5Y14DRAFT_427680 [Nemania sp. NC0429]